jgi:hypothetical protein
MRGTVHFLQCNKKTSPGHVTNFNKPQTQLSRVDTIKPVGMGKGVA